MAANTAATAHSGGAAAGGSGTPRLPLGSLEKVFSWRARHPSPGSFFSIRPSEALHAPPVLSWGWEGSVVQVGEPPTQERLRGQGQCRARIPSPARPHPSASTTRGTGAPLLPPRPPQKRAHSLDTHTPPQWGPKEDTGVKGNTTARPQTPEQRPGALQGHHRGPNKAPSCPRTVGAQCSSGTALPTVGRAARGAHTGKKTREYLPCQKTHGPH